MPPKKRRVPTRQGRGNVQAVAGRSDRRRAGGHREEEWPRDETAAKPLRIREHVARSARRAVDQVKDRLPEDGERHRFNKIGEALDVSHVQLARYLDTASYAMRQAMSSQLEHPAATTSPILCRDDFWPDRKFSSARERNVARPALLFPCSIRTRSPSGQGGRRSPLPRRASAKRSGRFPAHFQRCGWI